ncbi:hypothetical protein DYB34_011325, partial [Aphanomyces astaci]
MDYLECHAPLTAKRLADSCCLISKMWLIKDEGRTHTAPDDIDVPNPTPSPTTGDTLAYGLSMPIDGSFTHDSFNKLFDMAKLSETWIFLDVGAPVTAHNVDDAAGSCFSSDSESDSDGDSCDACDLADYDGH